MTETPLVQGRFVEPNTVVSNFHLREGDVVADLGAGSGFFAPVLSHAVGNSGRVYAVEVQKNLVDKISEVVHKQHLTNVRPIWGDIEELKGSELDDGEVDAVVVVNTLFQVEDKVNTLEEIKRVLRSGGKLFVIDWSESYAGLGPAAGEVLDVNTAQVLCESAGLSFERAFNAGDHHYGLAFRKP